MTSTATDAVPFVTYSRHLLDDPLNRLWHVHTWRWTGTDWQKTEVVKGLLSNPHATAAAQVSPLDTPLIHAWQNDAEVRWQAMDPATGAMIAGQERFTGHANANFPVGLAIDSGGLPVFSYVSAGVMRIGRWDAGQFPPKPAALPMLSCGVHYAPVHMAANNRYYSACQTAGAAASHIDLYFEDAMGGLDDVRVFGNDGHRWTRPDLAMVGDDAVVAALDETADAVFVRWQVNGVFQPPVKLLDVGHPIEELAVSARQAADGLHVAIVARNGAALYFADRRPDDPAPPSSPTRSPRRVDLNPDDQGQCGPGGNADILQDTVDVHLGTDTRAWINWQDSNPAAGLSIVKFTGFERTDPQDSEVAINGVKLSTTLARSLAGDTWSCFFREEGGNVNAYVRRGSDVEILVDLDVGGASDSYARGCDLDTDRLGNLHVVWRDFVGDRLRYKRRTAGGQWDLSVDLMDANGAIPASEHVAIAVEKDPAANLIAIAYRRAAGQSFSPCIVESYNMASYRATTCFSQSAPMMYPSLTTLGPEGNVYGLAYGTGAPSAIRFAIRTGFGAWSDEMLAPQLGFDFATSARAYPDGSQRAVVAWSDVSGVRVMLAERTAPGTWLGGAVENAVGELIDVKLTSVSDAEPTVTYRRQHAGQPSTLRLASWGRFSGGIPQGQVDPIAGTTLCDLRTTSGGTALELDDASNPRIGHRDAGGAKALFFKTRP